MSFLPDFPQHLTADVTANSISEKNMSMALALYNSCLDHISKQIFPCYVEINSNIPESVEQVIMSKIRDAGYNVKISYNTTPCFGPDKWIVIYNPLCATLQKS